MLGTEGRDEINELSRRVYKAGAEATRLAPRSIEGERREFMGVADDAAGWLAEEFNARI